MICEPRSRSTIRFTMPKCTTKNKETSKRGKKKRRESKSFSQASSFAVVKRSVIAM